MPGFIVVLLVVGVALIVYGIFLAISNKGKPDRHDNEDSRVEVVVRVPSVFDHFDHHDHGRRK